MEQDHGEKVRELEEARAEVEAAAAGWAVTVPVQVREVSAFARIAEQQSRIRLALPARRLAVRNAGSR